jgi:DNA-binding transcriptional ArsR family regulator
MAVLQLYSSLQQLPLFQGMSSSDLTNVIAHTKFGFIKVAKDKMAIKEGEICTNLVFLLNGTLKVESVSDDHSYKITEILDAPSILQPERLFGLNQRYTRTFIAETDVNFMMLDKSEAMKLTNDFIIFKLNLLNILSTQTQKITHISFRKCPADIRQRIIRFIEDRCMRPAGEKEILIHMESLAEEINESRLNVSKVLNSLNDEKLIELHRGGIFIPALEKLLM